MNYFSFRFLSFLCVLSVFLTACILPEKEDPFERLPQEALETISGKLFPFSVSISTRATHRLEFEGKLVGYLTSDIVQLQDFEGRGVELDGIWRTEKMRQIFWVEAIRVQDFEEKIEKDIEPEISRLTTKKFTFQHPGDWESTISPDGAAYFVDKNDINRRVFFNLKIQDYSPEESKIKPNILMNGFAGIKEVTNETTGKEKEKVSLFSNLENKKYIFEINYDFDDFDTKKAFLDVLSSFVEGEEQVQRVLEEEQKTLAEKESARLAAEEEKRQEESVLEVVPPTKENDPSFLDKLLGNDKEKNVEKKEEDIEIKIKEEVEEVIEDSSPNLGAPENLIDERSFIYENNVYGFSMKVPFGLWYRHYGPGYANITEMGFADNPLNSRKDVKFWMRIINKERPKEGLEELIVAGQVTLIKKRNSTSIFEFNGPLELRDYMWSIAQTLESTE